MKILRNVVVVWRVAWYEVKVMVLSAKFLVLSAVSWMFMDLFVMLIRQFALDYGEKLVPAILPFYFSDSIYCNIALLLLIFLFSSIPLKDESQKQLLQRSGIRRYGAGQLLAVAMVSVVYVVEQLLFSVLVCLPCVEFSGWGKIWQSVANGIMLELGYGGFDAVSQEVITNYEPWQAIGASALLFCLTGICYGMVVYLLNGISKGNLGTAVMSGWSLAWIFIQGMAVKWEWGQVALRLSPANWNNLSNKGAEDIARMSIRILLCIAVLIVVNQLMLRRRKIELM